MNPSEKHGDPEQRVASGPVAKRGVAEEG